MSSKFLCSEPETAGETSAEVDLIQAVADEGGQAAEGAAGKEKGTAEEDKSAEEQEGQAEADKEEESTENAALKKEGVIIAIW